MNARKSVSLVIGLGCALLGAEAAQFKFTTQTLTVPDGFEVQLVAGPPLVDRPIAADFDEQGRLYVTDSSGATDKAEKQLQDKPHRIVRLEDTDGDGRFDKTIVFADKMMFPEGAMWYHGSLYVAAPPSIWKLTDTDGDGVADKREEWFQGKTLTGCANDLHGPYAAPDGWIYWCKGAFAKQTYERPGKAPFVTRAAHIFRCRPDGTGIEPVMTGGMDNPVDVTFTASGERIFTTTFLQQPAGGKRDGLIHAIYGGVYGKVNDATDDHKKTGDLMPVLVHLGPAAPCGLTRYESRVFGAEYQDNLFACLFNLHKVTRHVLEPSGTTFKTRDEDFVTSDNTDFHPTDVIEDADGSLLLIDTGGWYKVCCPTSQLWKPDVLGAIYRIRRKGAAPVKDARGSQLAWNKMSAAQLCDLLADERVAVQKRSIDQLGSQGEKAVGALTKIVKLGATPISRRNAILTLTRISGEKARAAVRTGLHDKDNTVQQVACHSISIWRDSGAVPELLKVVQSGEAPLKRVAAEALGRIGEKKAVPALLAACDSKNDRVLEHSLTFALIEIGDAESTAKGLASENPATKRSALMALDQMDNGELTAAQVTPLLRNKDTKETASWIIGHHPEWGDALVDYFKARLADDRLSESEQGEIQRQLAQLSRASAIQDFLASVVSDSHSSKRARLIAFKAMAASGLKEAPEGWVNALLKALQDSGAASQAVNTVRAVKFNKQDVPQVSDALARVAHNDTCPAETRLEALAALPAERNSVDHDAFAFLCSNIDSDRPVASRTAAATALSKAKLEKPELLRLAEQCKSIGPLELSKVLSAFENVSDEEVGLRLVEALKQRKGLSGLYPDLFRTRLAKFPPSVQKEAESLERALNEDSASQKARLEEMLGSMKDGDVRRGQAIFNSQKTACATCHAIGYLGGNIGPDLTRIGQVRTERDLLEAVLYPSASFVRSYEPIIVTTKSGEDYNGIIRKDAADELVLATGPGTEVRIARSDITEMRPSTVSIMPQGLDQQLSRQELADLIAFLRATRW